MRHGERTVPLGDGTIGVLPEEWISHWQTALAFGETRGDRLRFGAHQAWFVDLLLSERLAQFVDREGRQAWLEQKQRLAEFERVTPVREPASFRGELRPYQREGLGWLEFLERQRFGGCLADDMGLGKTVQVLAWLLARKERSPRAAPALIVAPKSLTHNWLEEAQRFTPALRVLEYVGTDRARTRARLAEHDLVLTTYGTARSDVELLSEIEFGAVILDESQAIKNEDSRTAKSVRLLRAEHRLALSGTPIENHLGELWSLFEFLNPGLLGRSTTFQTLLGASEDGQVDEATRKLIAGAVRPFLLRRTKEEVLRDLPERTELTVA
ncbi:MAG TPA: SNF2-related protein, partial [Planctomycetota bacterium]|nr:SNF2-related protein [Planctomycetota bacterium]